MVIPEYCVNLNSVHKLVKENKVIVVFDENRCYFLNQDLNLKNVLGIGEQCDGLYYYNDKDLVLSVLTDSLNIDEKDNIVCCEIYQRAKQTREPFLLSDHTTKRVSFTVVDDYTKVVWVYLIKSKDEISNDDERGSNDLNKGKSDCSSSSVSGSNINIADFSVDSGNDVDSSDDLVATQNEEVATLEENIFSEYRYKAKLVAQGFRKKERIDYEETFSLVVKMVTVRCLLNIVVSMSWPVFQLDVNNAFLYGGLEEVVYMKPLEGYFPTDNKSDKEVFLALLVYMDDIIITGNSISEIEKFKVYLKSKFMIKDLGKLKYFIGIEVVNTDK
nr:ribonuclease H-like domain-containing protein [Tanacetum cinerariifolium]